MEKIKFEDWAKLDLRVGKIKSAKDHPNADRQYILMVDLGKGEHDLQIVSGLKEYYAQDELLGKNIVVLKNLEPRAIRGVESQGMLLAAIFKEKVILLQPEKDIETGAKVE
ncbi:MAG: hypothetical protein ABIB47_02715 [Candidatus Woesearchaeota archaeon]